MNIFQWQQLIYNNVKLLSLCDPYQDVTRGKILRIPPSRKEVTKSETRSWGQNCATLPSGDINTGPELQMKQ
jgi:hypothetical protein